MKTNSTFSSKTRLNQGTVASGSPLAPLYSSDYNFESLYYPRNLGSSNRGHYIVFYINVASNSSYVNGSSYGGNQTIGNSTNIGVLSAGGRTAINQQNLASNMPGGTKTVTSVFTVRKTKRITQGIALYMPDTVNVSYNASWQSESLTEALGNLGKYGGATTTVTNAMSNRTMSGLSPLAADILGGLSESSGLTGQGSRDFALFTQGAAVNPQIQVLFKGTEMRSFSFEFLFTPHDEAEAENILNIIKTFKFHQAPEVNTSSVGRYFGVPSEFDIDFFKDGQINDKLHQIGTVVLSGLDVDYSPNGWSTFENGMPTQIRMTLQFQETEIVTKERVQKDNY